MIQMNKLTFFEWFLLIMSVITALSALKNHYMIVLSMILLFLLTVSLSSKHYES